MSIQRNTNGQRDDKRSYPDSPGKGWWKFILPLVLMLAVLGTLMVANNASAGVPTSRQGIGLSRLTRQSQHEHATPEKHNHQHQCQHQTSATRGALCNPLRPVR